MEVLQCDGCDFRAESYDELKTHIQEVHTAFLQPADADESDSVMEEDEEDEGEEQHKDKDDTDYVPPKSAPSPELDTSNHTPPKPTAESLLPFFQCKFCVRYFRSKSFLRNHTIKVHNITEDDSDSSECSETSNQPSSNVTHNDHSKVYSCQYCTYKTPRKARLLKHQIMYHNKEANSSDYVEGSGDSDLTSKGAFTCEWCTYKTDQKDRWTDHVVKDHSDKVKTVSGATDLEKESSAVSPKQHAPSSGNSPSMSTPEEPIEQTSENNLENPIAEISSFQYAQINAVTPNSTGTSILSQKFASTDLSKSISEIDNEEESQSSLEDDDDDNDDDVDDDDDDEELGDTDDPSYTGTLSADVKLLLSDEDNKLMETKGIPFRKYMNRFQCPFCSFLTMHRRSISRHIENIHVSGKATVYKCDECPFVCTSPLKLGTHKQTHNASDVDTFDLTVESPEHANDSGTEPVIGSNLNAKVNGKKSTSTSNDSQNPHRCSLCSFSTTTLKGLRVHQQHKHSYCDDLDATAYEGQLSDQLDESNSSPILVQKAQTSILGLATKKPLVTGKRARKSINDLPLDLSSVKKRTRIDEIASNLQSKISQSQQDLIINLDDLDDEDNHSNADVEGSNHDGNHVFAYNTHQLQAQDLAFAHESGRIGKRKSNPKSKPKSIPISLTLSDDSENMSANPGDSRDTGHDSNDFSDESGNTRFYCKHCDYHNKSARSVSTHYQRMHPYIKFSFKYILDPEDQSAVFRCLECYIEYNNYNDLHQHYMDHHPEASNVLNFNQPDLVYMCRFCSYTSPNVRSLMPHYQRMHPTVKINNAMIFSSYVVEQSHKTSESQTLREILNSGPKSFKSSNSNIRSSSSPLVSKTPDISIDTEATEVGSGNVVVYDCDVCSFASPNMHSVLVHYQKKHPEQKASYFRIQKNMKVISVDQSQPAVNSYNISITSTPKTSSSTAAAAVYGSDEDMFYCKHCVYSNRSVVGVLVHYQKRHPEVKVTAKYIKNGPPTAGLMKLMDELQIAAPKQFLKQIQNSIQEESTPKPGSGEKGEDELFFCQHCDYGNRSVKGVLIHYQKKHKETKASADMVRRHTAVVRSQRERAQMVQSSSVSAAVVPTQSDPEAGVPLRSLKCRHCSYTSPYVYALKKHLKKEHPTVKATAMTILHWAYQDGILEAGYHCEWCIYSHAEPQGLLVHYQKRHPEHNVDYAYMASKLWAGPETIQTGGNVENKHYKCKDCAFEACTTWDITSHYQAIHPWVIKEDESVLLDIIKGDESIESTHQSLPKDHPAYDCQPIDDDAPLLIATPPRETHTHSMHPRLSISNNTYQCTVCLSEYNSLHGLLTHYGKKHPGMKVKAADFAQEADINPSSVYKCRHCPYVNSRIHGVLTHYQKRHPQVKVTAEDFADDIEQLSDIMDVDDKCKTQRQGFGAYRCKMCSYTHGTLEKLKIHYEKYHNRSVSDIFSSALTNFTSREAEPVAECSASNSASVSQVQEVNELELHGISGISQLPVNKPEKHAVFKCQLCKYFCSTRKGIARHYRIKHNNVRAQPEGKNNVFKCALCAYTNPIRKGLAAHYQKRHDIDAYYTHCLAASKTMTEKPNKVPPPPPPEADNTEMAEDIRLAVEQRKCSLCPFQAFSKKSIVSHYIKRHPGVFPKKQPGSKLGRYFTVIYAKENENNVGSELQEEQKEGGEDSLDHELDKDDELLPFKCLKCFRLSFSRGELLSLHYNDHHGNDLMRDFGVSPGPGEEDELYKCSHCELSFLTLESLAKHLISHNEDFQKKAMRQERRRQLLSRQKSTETPDAKVEKESSVSKVPIGFRCNFCVEVHTTLRAICNHLRKHVQYGEAKEGHVKQEVSEVPLTMPLESLTNGDVEEGVPDANNIQAAMSPALISTSPAEGSSATEEEPQTVAIEGRAAALVAAARAVVSGAQMKQRLGVGGHPCAQCDRVFMSMQGLRSHERSHMAMAMFNKEDKYSCQYCQFTSPFRHNLDRHVQSHHGHHKPFKCKLCPFKSAYLNRLKSHLQKAHTGEQHMYKCLSCPFSSTTISQLKEHSQRDHGEVLTLPKLRAATQSAHFSLKPRLSCNSEQSPLPSTDDHPYLEPADVRQQLSHYQLASRSQMSSGSTPGGSAGTNHRADGIFTCEYCEFSSGYIQSLRRHYRDRHGGKKLFKCKDCPFFTCDQNTLSMHAEAGHNNNSTNNKTPDELPKDLRCPLCLYHTKNKSNMIDHIVLHREERVAPLEVSRSKLSRHLQGLVFRCHKCTFTCSSDQALQMHLQKHAEIKPFQCQLCYYDSSRKSQLEEHLRLEHKVIRNFELMGRVNLDHLDHLEMIKEQAKSGGEEEEPAVMKMVMNEKNTMENDEYELMNVTEEEEAREINGDEGMEDNSQEEEAEEEDDDSRDLMEAEPENLIRQEVTESPTSSSGTRPNSDAGKRLPCEFCGRCFTNCTEWERHVLRHGMVVNSSQIDTSSTSAIEASSSMCSSVLLESGLDLSNNSREEEDFSNASQRSQSLFVEDKEMLDTKNDQQFG